MADIAALVLSFVVLAWFLDILELTGAIVLFIFSRAAEVIDILIDKLRGAGG